VRIGVAAVSDDRPYRNPNQRALAKNTTIDGVVSGALKIALAQDEPSIAAELLLKLALRSSPRTASGNRGKARTSGGRGDQRRSTFMRNHAKAIVGCDFF